MGLAISYRRFSTLKQASGNSERRQSDLTEGYCKRNDLRLIDTYLDAGVSGFTGANLSDGSALHALLQAAKNGRFQPGTRLIVESLDRLSRHEITKAVRLLLDILDTGLVIVTLIDGEQVFTKERVDSDLTALIIAIVYLSRANNEARARRERALDAQQAARKKAREQKTPITAECPAWLTLISKGKSRRFVINEKRAQVVEHIFKMSASGLGQYQIVAFLNGHDVATFSGKPKWRPGMIGHLLSSQAVIGVLHPCLSVVENGKRRRVPDPAGPIAGYFPAIISEDLYAHGRLAAKARLRRGDQRNIPAFTNLVPRIGRCAVCGATLHHFQNVGGWAYLRCANARHKECSNRFGFPYAILETVLLALDDLTTMAERLTSGQREHTAGTEGFDPADRAAWLSRFKAVKMDARSSDAAQRTFGRRLLVAELRLLLEGVVLHANRCITVHLRPDVSGCRAVCLIGRDGLQGIQVKAPAGTTGFIERSVLREIMPPTISSRHADERSMRVPPDLDAALARTRIIHLPDGDWQAVAPEPMQIGRLVADAEKLFGFARRCFPEISDAASG